MPTGGIREWHPVMWRCLDVHAFTRFLEDKLHVLSYRFKVLITKTSCSYNMMYLSTCNLSIYILLMFLCRWFESDSPMYRPRASPLYQYMGRTSCRVSGERLVYCSLSIQLEILLLNISNIHVNKTKAFHARLQWSCGLRVQVMSKNIIRYL